MIDTLSYSIDRKVEFKSNLERSIRLLERSDPLISDFLGKQHFEEHWRRLILSLDANFTCKVEVGSDFKYVNSLYSPWAEAERQVSNMREVGKSRVVHYFGIGLGYHLALLLRDNPDLEKLFLYEYDAGWLIKAFSIHDFSRLLLNDSIKIFLRNVQDPPESILKMKSDIIWVNPVLGKVYDSHYSGIFNRGVNIDSSDKDTGIIVDYHSDPSYQNLTNKVYNEIAGSGRSVIRVGHDCLKIKVQCFRNRPKFLFSVSFSPELSEISREAGVPYICWELDKVMNGNFIRPHTLSLDTFVFTSCDEDVLKFKYAGASAFYLPPVSNIEGTPDSSVPEEGLERFEYDISFVGSSLICSNNDFSLFERNVYNVINHGNEEVRREGVRLMEALRRALERQLPFTMKNEYRLKELLAEELNSVYPLRVFKFSHIQLHNILAKECCKVQRLGYLKQLAPLTVSVFGNSDWEEVTEPNLVYKGVADYDSDCKKIYRTSKINIDITRIYQLDGFSDRVLNILSYGGFLLMNRTRMIEKSFEADRELVLFDSPEELKEKCEYYLKADTERREIALRGMRRAAEDHTVKKRVREIFSRLPARLRRGQGNIVI